MTVFHQKLYELSKNRHWGFNVHGSSIAHCWLVSLCTPIHPHYTVCIKFFEVTELTTLTTKSCHCVTRDRSFHVTVSCLTRIFHISLCLQWIIKTLVVKLYLQRQLYFVWSPLFKYYTCGRGNCSKASQSMEQGSYTLTLSSTWWVEVA